MLLRIFWMRLDKLYFPCIDNRVTLTNLTIYCTCKITKKVIQKKNWIKRLRTTWDEEFELPGRSYSISDIQNSFKYIIRNHKILTYKRQFQTYLNKFQKRVTFKTKSGYLRLWNYSGVLKVKSRMVRIYHILK